MQTIILFEESFAENVVKNAAGNSLSFSVFKEAHS